ncbi:pyridoxamine 5'-phosphate oxidase [Microbulbifer sp. OS29]|uniref:Pyridoxine/pyridoxamine 5'-phosphate oxidase n=1 Tax=Microbulbifer okhotskensis TaxID=2926617 RepID=A0A9X2J7Z3_9GAMM|nr:pyridoxamine 5'-phosphate oxidase [Microbulbifer okhotskensis]MCO1336315.1 pyridoxamine 5'-phosphate oxidase [Microbulbifer okhotskensis]
MEIDQWRREYLLSGLRRSELKPTPLEQLRKWLSEAVEAGLADPNAMCLATVNTDGQPAQRIVLLKGVDERGFTFYTNLQSDKARDMAENPQVSLLFPWHSLERQIIVYGKVAPVSREQAKAYFQSRPLDSQLAAWASRQSQSLSSREELQHQFEQEKSRFAGKDVPLPEFWGGYCVVPSAVEFWQGGANRLHDRFIYRIHDNGSWAIERLSP